MGWREHHIDWHEATRGVPVQDYLDGHDLSSAAGRVEAVESFTLLLELRRWHTWEAVIRDEQRLPLAEAHELILDELISFSEDQDEPVLYVNDSPRPCEPWYASARRLAETLSVSRYDTAADHYEGVLTAGEDLLLAIETHGEQLSLPPGARKPRDAIGPELWDWLTVQVALDMFSGVGRGGAPVDGEMVDLFLRMLRDRIGAVVGLDASLDDVLAPLVLPQGERERLVRAACEVLGIRDSSLPMAYPLECVEFDMDWDERWPSPFDDD